MRAVVWLGLVSLCMSLPLWAQRREEHETKTPEVQRRAADAHSFMELFTKLERDWNKAVQNRDRVALDTIVAPEFVEWSSTDPEHPVERNLWIQNALTDKGRQGSVGQRSVSIRAFRDNAVVSFVQWREGEEHGDGRVFVVDLWVADHGAWRAAARYISPLTSSVQTESTPTKPY